MNFTLYDADRTLINILCIILVCICFEGAITGFAAFINVIKVGSVTSSGGNQLETQILIALVLGGMPISGGAKVRFENIIVGSLLYIVLNSGLTMMGFSTQMMQLIQGIVFLIFVAVFADRESIQVIK